MNELKGNIIDAELRYTEGWAAFPIAGMIFMKMGYPVITREVLTSQDEISGKSNGI